jgi:hypothetical protein
VKMMMMIGSNVASLSQKVVALSARVEEMVLPCSFFSFRPRPRSGPWALPVIALRLS